MTLESTKPCSQGYSCPWEINSLGHREGLQSPPEGPWAYKATSSKLVANLLCFPNRERHQRHWEKKKQTFNLHILVSLTFPKRQRPGEKGPPAPILIVLASEGGILGGLHGISPIPPCVTSGDDNFGSPTTVLWIDYGKAHPADLVSKSRKASEVAAEFSLQLCGPTQEVDMTSEATAVSKNGDGGRVMCNKWLSTTSIFQEFCRCAFVHPPIASSSQPYKLIRLSSVYTRGEKSQGSQLHEGSQ